MLWGWGRLRAKSQRLQPVFKKKLGHTGTRVGQKDTRSASTGLPGMQAAFEIAQELWLCPLCHIPTESGIISTRLLRTLAATDRNLDM